MIEKVQQQIIVDDLGTAVIMHPETSSDNVLHQGGTLDELITLDQKRKRNFNFIGNKVVQDGLIENKVIANSYEVNSITYAQDFTIQIKLNANSITDYSAEGHLYMLGKMGISPTTAYFDTTTPMLIFKGLTIPLNRQLRVNELITIVKKDNTFTFYICDEIKTVKLTEIVTNNVFIGGYGSFSFRNNSTITTMIYNRSLAPQEIQHNISVLSNSPSVNTLSVGDKKLLWAVDSQHVEMATGRTWEEEYTALLKDFGKEFTSSGSAISVSNGIKGKVLSGEIKGQTVKNELYDYKQFVKNYGATPTYQNDGILVNTDGESQFIFTLTPKQNTDYEINFYVENIKDGGGKVIALFRDSTKVSEFSIVSGKNTQVINSQTATTIAFRFYAYIQNGLKIKNISIVEKSEVSKITYPLPLGLSSTQAIINNNGQSYAIYEPTIVGKTRILRSPKGANTWTEISIDETRDTATYDYKLDSVGGKLGSVSSSIYDYIDRVRKVKVVNTKEIELNTLTDWNVATTDGSITRFYDLSTSSEKKNGNSNIVCNSFTTGVSSAYFVKEVSGYDTDGRVYIKLPNSIATTVAQLNTYLAQQKANGTPITIRYQLATPIEIPMTDEELKAYDAYKKVILCNGVSDVYDTFEIKEDGSGIYTQNRIRYTITGNEEIKTLGITSTNTTRFTIVTPLGLDTKYLTSISNRLSIINRDTLYANDIEGLSMYVGGEIFARLPKTSVGETIDSIKTYLKQQYALGTPIVIDYPLKTPIVTTIDKSIMPTIQTTDKINICQVESAVAPSSLKLTLPVDRIGEMQTQIDGILATLSSPSNAALTYNYIEDEYNKNLKHEKEVIL